MCGRFTYLTYEELVDVVGAVARGGASSLEPGISRREARPGSTVHALVPDTSRLEIAPFTWGFSVKDKKRLVFNTRIESALAGSPLWAGPIRDGRCIVPVASFFEPHETETTPNPRTGRPTKRQYEFASANGTPLLLAGVHDSGRLSIVTTEPNASVSAIHARMPLALRFEEVTTWLEGDIACLADRSGIELSVAAENTRPPDDGQMQLLL